MRRMINCRWRWLRTLRCVLLTVLGLSGVATAPAGVITWTKGGGTLNWNTAANWDSNAVPGTADTAKIAASGTANNDTLLLGANQTITTLDLSTSATNFTIGGDGFSLTLTNGNIKSSSTPGNAMVISAPLTLGAPGSFAWAGNYGSSVRFQEPITDGGYNYGLTLSPGDQTVGYVFAGNSTYGGTTVLRANSLTLSGPNGAITNSAVTLSQRSNQSGALILDNTLGVNNNRLGDSKDLVVERVGGGIQILNASAAPVAEQAGTVWLNAGILNIKSAWGGTNVQLRFAGINRSPGSAMTVYCMNGVAGSNNVVGFVGATNTCGIWQPWALANPYYVNFMKVNAATALVELAASDYTELPASGADPAKPYWVTTTNPVILSASESVYALSGNHSSSNVTIQLGGNDLRVVSGAIIGQSAGGPVINSTGGRLLFGGNEIILSVSRNVSGANSLTLNCPILCEGSGAKHILVPYCQNAITYSLLGTDQNGTYAGISGIQLATIELGGSSDRAVTQYLNGGFALLKTGSGTLRLSGVDQRGQYVGTTMVKGGRLVLTNNLALSAAPTVTNATLEIAAGITNSLGVTLQYGATLTGDGTLAKDAVFTNGVHIAPGGTVGKFTISGNATFRDGAQIDWDLGNGTNNAGADYDLLNITGNLNLPASPATLTLHVRDAGNGLANPKGATFTVAQWSGSCLTNSTLWSVANDSPRKFDTSSATVIVNTNSAVKKILLSGIRRLAGGSVLSVR